MRRLRPRLNLIYPSAPPRRLQALPKLLLRLAGGHGDDTSGSKVATGGFAFSAGCFLLAATAAAADEAIAKARPGRAAPDVFFKEHSFPSA